MASIKQLDQQLQDLLHQNERFWREQENNNNEGWAFGYLEGYAQWRYENPKKATFISIVFGLAFVSLVLSGLWVLAATNAGKATGLSLVRERIEYGYYAVMWSTRLSPDYDILPITPTRYSGTIERVIGDMLVVSYYNQGAKNMSLIRPANVVVTSQNGFEGWASEYILKGVTLDFYAVLGRASGHDVWSVVIWHSRKPVNVELVERGMGYPEVSPPTAVVNQIFSQYYWQRALHGGSDLQVESP